MLRPEAKTTGTFRVKALHLYLTDNAEGARVQQFLKELGGVAVLADETRPISRALWTRALEEFVRIAGEEALGRLGPYLIHPEALGAWARVLRGATRPDSVFAHVTERDRMPGDSPWREFRPEEGGWTGLIEFGADDTPVMKRYVTRALVAEAAAIPALFGQRARASKRVEADGSLNVRVEWHKPWPPLLRALLFVATLACLLLLGQLLFPRHAWNPGLGLAFGLCIVGFSLAWLAFVSLSRDRAREVESSMQRVRILALEREAVLRQERPREIARPHEEPIIAGQYKVGKQLGVGGSGAVWQATRLTDNAQVALKLIRTAIAHDVRATDRLRREAEALGLAWHPNVVQVLDHGILPSGVAFLVMEHLEGESLAERLQRIGRLSEGETLALGLELAEALIAIHSAGIIHRDIKPGNLFIHRVEPDAELLKVIDFGVARVSWAETRLTRSGVRIGTFGYAPPEQEEGADVDARSDLFAVGVTLRECLTGLSPAPGVQTVSAPRGVELEEGWVRFLEDLTAPSPDHRLASAREMRDRLLGLKETLPSMRAG